MMNTCAILLVCISALLSELALGHELGARYREFGAINESDEPLPSELDWSKDPNRVSPVVDHEGPCHADHIFTALYTIEGQLVARNITKTLVKLSAQQIVDCLPVGYTCKGWYDYPIYDHITQMGGIQSEKDYGPYTGVKSECKFDETKAVTKSIDCDLVSDTQSEDEVQRKLYKYGPLSVVIAGLPPDFENYSGGVFKGPCMLNVGYEMLASLVGYGTDPKEGDYWKLKLARGTKWGENGYLRIVRGANMCYIADIAKFVKWI